MFGIAMMLLGGYLLWMMGLLIRDMRRRSRWDEAYDMLLRAGADEHHAASMADRSAGWRA